MNIPAPLAPENTALVLIDYQERLFPVMSDKEKLLKYVVRLVNCALTLEVPVVLTEQYPKGLGPTIPEIKTLLQTLKPIEKTCFSCCDNEEFSRYLESLKRKQLLIAGIEAHICVYQTAAALARKGYEVQVVSDCVSSRDPENKALALARMTAMGILPTSVEMAAFEMLKVAQGDKFKKVSGIIK
jgi:nicotinamidase-related amidase